MHAGHFARVGVHASGGFARLDVSPDHWGHVAFVVHKTGIEVGGFVGIGGLDVGEASGEGVFLCFLLVVGDDRGKRRRGARGTDEEVEHGEELARGHQHVVAEPAVRVSREYFSVERGEANYPAITE